jgi:hypothetical protein
MFSLVYPENKLIYLFTFSKPDAIAALDNSLEHSIFDSIGYLLNILYFIALSKYIYSPKKIISLLLLSSYISYTANSYMSRGAILRIIVVIFLLYYFKYPAKRKLLLIVGAASSVFLIMFFVSYMYYRSGGSFEMIDLSLAIEKIAEIELSFSAPFDKVIQFNNMELGEYLWWFFSMPLPGALKFGTADIFINGDYTSDILGMNPNDVGFFIVLPGLVGEGVYMCGQNFFFVHAILFALVCNYLYNTLSQSKAFYVLLVYYMINIPFGAIRAGTQGLYPLTNKIIPFALILLYLFFYFHKRKIVR